GTVNLLRVTPGAEAGMEATVRVLLSARPAYVSGHVITLTPAGAAPPVGPAGAPAPAVPAPAAAPAAGAPPACPADAGRPHAGAVALVTGAAGGIGAACARVLARDGATVVCLDLTRVGDALAAVANEVGGTALQLDLTAPDAPERLVGYLAGRFGRLDILVQNA